MLRSRYVLLTVGALAWSASTLSTGCSDCDTDCGQFDGRIVEAELLDRDEGELRLRLREGGDLVVTASGRAEVLDEGDSYLFPLFENGSGRPEVVMAQPCACGGYVKNLDGSTVDTGFLTSLPSLGSVAAVTLISFAALAVAWGTWRHRRGEPV